MGKKDFFLFIKAGQKINIKHVIAAGFIFRLLAVYFSRGYAFYDDHFAVIELAQRWFEGNIKFVTGDGVYVFSLLYPGLHYLLIAGCDFLGITDPEGIMMVARLFHAIVSMVSIYYAYLLTYSLTNQKRIALISASLLALFWVFPFMSVRNLREFFCIPFLLAGSYYSIRQEGRYGKIIFAALFFALSVCIRIQCIFIPFGIGLSWLFKMKDFKIAFLFGTSFLIFFFLTQGVFDWLYYGSPLASTLEYFKYNANPENIAGYPQGPWYQYILTIGGGTFGFPFLLLLAGYIFSSRTSAGARVLFFSSLIFFVFHSYYVNKQERFILPFLPYFLILGVIGFSALYERYKENKWMRGITKAGIAWFVFFNTILLFVLTFSYSKRSMVEAMKYLHKKKDFSGFVIDGETSIPRPPLFYLGKNTGYYEITMTRSIKDLDAEIKKGNNPRPNYIIFAGSGNLDKRIERLKSIFPELQKDTEIPPGFIDGIAYKLNPEHNKNETWYIYRVP